MKKLGKVFFMSCFVLANGVNNITFAKDNSHIIMQEGSSLPISQISFFIPKGTAQLDEKSGSMSVMKKIIALSPLTQTIEKHGGSSQIFIDKDSFNWQITILDSELESFLDQFIPLLKQFQFTQTVLDDAKKQQLQDIEFVFGDPNQRSQVLFQEKAFSGHPYGTTPIGNKKDVEAIQLKDLQLIWDNLFHDPESLYLICISSHIDHHIQTLLEKIWGSFEHSDYARTSATPAVPLFTQTESWKIIDPHLSQSFVHFAYVLPSLDESNRYLMLLFQEIVGGGFNSRLFKILRAQYGLTYSPHVIYKPLVNAQLFDIFFSTKVSSTDQSLDVVNHIMQDIKTNGITQEELDTTKKLVYNSILRIQEDNASLGQLIANDILYHRPIGNVKLLEESIRNCNLDTFNHFVKNILETYPPIKFVLAGKDAKG